MYQMPQRGDTRMTNIETDSLSKGLKHWRLRQKLTLESVALKTRIPLKYLRALESNDFSTLPPIDEWPRTLGDSLRRYREQQGLSLEGIADHTRVPLMYLKALEENNSLHMPAAPVIARSFVESYLSCLTIQESEKEDLLVQYAQLAEIVYTKRDEESTIVPAHASAQIEQAWIPSRTTVRDRAHHTIWTLYLATVKQRARLCEGLMSGSRATWGWIRRVLHQIVTATVDAWHTTSDIALVYTERIMSQFRGEKGQPTPWQRTRKTLSASGSSLRHSWAWMQRSLPSFPEWHLARTPESHELTISLSDSPPTHLPERTLSATWSWVIRHGVTVGFLILLGSTADKIPVLTETMLVGTALNVSHLMEFLSYGTVLIVVGLVSRHIARLLDRDRSGLTIIRPLVAPMTTLLMVSALHKILLIMANPFFSKSDHLVYNWIFVLLILASTVWIILAWFFRSAPILESISMRSHSRPPSHDAGPSLCPHCKAMPQPGMKFCGHCGGGLATSPN